MRKTSTCLTLPALPDPAPFSRLDELGLVAEWVSGLSQIVRWWPAGPSWTGDADDAVARAFRLTPWHGGWPTSRLGGNQLCWKWSCVATGAPGAGRFGAKTRWRGLRWALGAIVRQHLAMVQVAEGLSVGWDTANDAVLAEGRRVLSAMTSTGSMAWS